MSGIDKLYLTPPEITVDNEIRRYSLQELLIRATLCRYIYYPGLLPGEKKQVIRFRDYPGIFIAYEGYFCRNSSYINVISHIILNPSRLGSHVRMARFLAQIDTGWLRESIISRCDFAADYRAPMEDILEAADLRRIHNTKLYIEDAGGVVETLYAGEHPDVMAIYDRNRYYRACGWRVENPDMPYIRIERQIRTLSAFRRAFGRNIRYTELEIFMNEIAQGLIDPFLQRIHLANFVPNDRVQMTDVERQRLDAFRAVARTSSYGRARRWADWTSGDNFQRQYAPLFTREDFPAWDQPSYILRRAILGYLSGIKQRVSLRHIPAASGLMPRGVYV